MSRTWWQSRIVLERSIAEYNGFKVVFFLVITGSGRLARLEEESTDLLIDTLLGEPGIGLVIISFRSPASLRIVAYRLLTKSKIANVYVNIWFENRILEKIRTTLRSCTNLMPFSDESLTRMNVHTHFCNRGFCSFLV